MSPMLAPEGVDLIEVELTRKRMPPYAQIFRVFHRRFDGQNIPSALAQHRHSPVPTQTRAA